jgi:hypothetical protein
VFFFLLLSEGTFTSFFKAKKVRKKSQNSKIQGFSYYFYLMIEEESISVPVTNGSGWAKNIRIRNTALKHCNESPLHRGKGWEEGGGGGFEKTLTHSAQAASLIK